MAIVEHALPRDIERGRVYKSLRGKWSYKVERIADMAGEGRQVFYVVFGGPLHEHNGRCHIGDFCKRVRA